MSGTEWVEPGAGSTLYALFRVFNWTRHHNEFPPSTATNLHLTGAPITDEDWARLESAEFKVGA